MFGIIEPKKTTVAHSAYFALYALQHRGQQSCGIAVNDDGVITAHKDIGLVPEVFSAEVLEKLGEGTVAVGHTRYSATDKENRQNCEPMSICHVKGPLSVATSGCLTNANELRRAYEMEGAIFHTSTDAELIAYTIAKCRLTSHSIEKATEMCMEKIKGGFALVLMSATKLLAVRDPHGVRPLCIGKTETGGYVFASESCALAAVGAEFVRDVLPGEIVKAYVEDGEVKLESIQTFCHKCDSRLCVFEHVYFARPDSIVDGASVHKARQRAGAFLALEHPVQADIVIGVPDSGLDAALGFARQSGIPYGVGFIKNKYIGRSFIQPTQDQRDMAVRIKLSAVKETVCGKRVVMIDDSIVRGTTSARIVKLLREAGATEVHMRISSPPFLYPCYYGTDIDSQDKLIACRMSVEEIAEHIGVDSLGYLSIPNVNQIAEGSTCGFCDACFTGNYPVKPPKCTEKHKFEKKISENL